MEDYDLSIGEMNAPSSRTILVVDDEEAFCEVVCEILTNAGYHTVSAPSAEEARRLLDQYSVDLILSDVMMPGTHGLSFIYSLRQDPRWRGLPIIVASAKAGKADRQEAAMAGANDFLAKPFSSHELQAAIARHISSS